ncbi:hypothetical protein PQE75_gp006 [Bacillus phage vB_BcoS-136]|uniref:Uncharacterized protein n=1 Tax=Bacillus phage vB_BcoS-136 TaxID=2419619 RepID=A0A3G3BV84_9CAUD|nr:hypothetical protein PQE75_gp006 [Bacillus phage vB_BcoS-136]AYP68138.1 hypothetical protein vBBcoS136_00006 [Bacillus phage vB_BcoS-136]
MQKTVSNKLVEKQLEMSKYIGQRKHSSQLSQQEKELIWNRLYDVNDWKVHFHALDRLEQKSIDATYEDLVTTIFNSDIVEYKIDYNRYINRCVERVVLRSKSIVNDRYNMHVVYDISSNMIITVWINHVKDFHRTLDWSLYNENMKVFGED